MAVVTVLQPKIACNKILAVSEIRVWSNTMWLTSRNAIWNQHNTGAKPKQAFVLEAKPIRKKRRKVKCRYRGQSRKFKGSSHARLVFPLISVSYSIVDGWCTTMTFCTWALKSIPVRRFLVFTLRAICTQPTEFISFMSYSVVFCGFIRC